MYLVEFDKRPNEDTGRGHTHSPCEVLITNLTMMDMKDNNQLLQAVKDISGQWYLLCKRLKVEESKISQLKESSDSIVSKMTDCLEAYIKSARASWEEVVVVVAKFPFSNPYLAREIAKDNLKGFNKEKVLEALQDDVHVCIRIHSDYVIL